MHCSRKFLVLTGCATVLCGSLLVVTATGKNDEKDKGKEKAKAQAAQESKGEKKKDEKKSEGKKSDAASPEGGKVASKLVIPLPEGQDSKGVTIPYKDGSGKKSMVFKIGVGTRVDDNHVKMRDLFIEMFGEGDAPEMTVTLPSSVLDINAGVITGDESVTIDRSDFQITGKNMEFRYETRSGRIKGDVKMIIYDLNKEASATPGATKAASSNPNPSGS